MKYRSISYNKNQEIALDILESVGIDTEKCEIPNDPEYIARYYEMPPNIISGLFTNFGIRGCVYKFDNSFSIGIDENHYYNQEESSIFTLGEEIGHIFLHLKGRCNNINSPQDWLRELSEDIENSDKIENQARVFSSNIILPPVPLYNYVNKWIQNHKTTFKIEGLLATEDFANKLGSALHSEMKLSPYIIQYSLLRWPDRCAKRLLREIFDI